MGGRLPVDGKKVTEHRITLGTFERKLLDDLALSYRIQAFDQNAILEVLKSPKNLVEIMYSIATIFEMIGMETGLPTVADIPEVIEWLQKHKDNPKVKAGWDLLTKLWSGELGGYPGGY